MAIKNKMLGKIRYRIWQMREELRTRKGWRADEINAKWERLLRTIPKKIKGLLNGHTNAEKAHLMRVYEGVAQDSLFAGEEQELYLRLALVHDVGKVVAKVRLWQKVLKVLLGYDFMRHAQVGSAALRALGTDEELVQLVLRHHDAADCPLLRRFQEYDDRF